MEESQAGAFTIVARRSDPPSYGLTEPLLSSSVANYSRRWLGTVFASNAGKLVRNCFLFLRYGSGLGEDLCQTCPALTCFAPCFISSFFPLLFFVFVFFHFFHRLSF